ncbi:MAG: response regulator [Acidobacteriota bacterium]|nr:response regulator [Blastocatellia bacterium]MDW8411954.1 response regulator [Acidobacteriota bacterium]
MDKRKILIIEDDDQFRTVLLKRLQMPNYDVLAAENGLVGWELIKTYHPDLIISDLMMPGIDGQQLCKKVKSDPALEHIYFIMLTARDSIDDRVAGLEIGADDYISKPVNNKELIARVKAGLRISSLYNQVKASEKRLRALIENASDAIVIFNSESQIIEANEKACQLFRYTKNQMLSMSFADLLAEHNRAQAKEKFDAMRRIGNFTEELLMQRCDGALVPVESANSVIDTDLGKVFQSILRDLTRRKEVEQHLLQVEKLRALGGMVSGIAHDFNNLLAAILGYTELAIRDTKDSTLLRRLKIIEKAAKDGAETVRLLQEFAKVRSNSPIQALDVNKTLEQALLLTRHKWKDEAYARGVSIKVETSLAQLPPVQAVLPELREAFTNIIFNAVDAILEKETDNGLITIKTYAKNEQVFIEIIDNGIGMSHDIQDRLFEPFFTTKGPSHSGLGLPACYGIIQRYGGTIRAESSLGSGSTFHICLPATKPTVTLAEQPKGHYSVLLIDDEDIVRGAMEEILLDEGFAVVPATTGAEGIELFLSRHFDLVITDLGMPGLHGWDVIKQVKEKSPTTPVILLTGWANQTDLTLAQERAVTLLAKPISGNELVTVIAKLLKGK